ncbi:MAG: FitA-like ribbon-helix-helix domain-containing protein [Candidatus Dormibacteraceae bacterium]
MATALQIRDVPDEVRDVIAGQARARGQSMQAYLLEVLRREARLADNARLFELTAAHRVDIPDALSPERIVREGREGGFDADRGDPPA